MPEWFGVLIYLIYGLSFFTLGLTAFFSSGRGETTVPLLRYLSILGWFGVIHAVVEWSTLFLRYFVGPDSYIPLAVATTLFTSLSFVILMNFGLRIELCYHNFNKRIRFIPKGVFVCYLLIGFFLLKRGRDVVQTINYLEAVARIGIAFPAALLVAVGLHDSGRHLATFCGPQIPRRLYLLSVTFLLYGALAGIVVDPLHFFQLYRFPVELLRTGIAIIALMVFMSVTRGIDRISTEKSKNLKSKQLLQEERERVGRELHDKVIQVLFATGLRLEQVANTDCLAKESEDIYTVRNSLNKLIREIRVFISRSETQSLRGSELISMVTEHCNALQSVFPAEITVITDIRSDLLSSVFLYSSEDLQAILTEAVSNAVKHGHAKTMQIRISLIAKQLVLSIIDDGIGFPSTIVEGRGLPSMRDRADKLNGRLTIDGSSKRNSVILSISLKENSND
ncbi:MAG: histidine kinase [Spirochaetia bacterium]|nr:histidine kinase [Spirochaetia bacterium]